jgi:hypothetical protein
MNNINKTALTFCMTLLLGASCTSAFAEETTTNSTTSINETITHVEKALTEVNKSDFSAAQLHLKSARLSSENITGDQAKVKLANDSVIQGQIQAKHGDIKESAAELNKALSLYKSL